MTDSQLPRDQADLLDRIEMSWNELWKVVGGLGRGQMEVPDAGGWSIKDNLAHLAAWEQFMRLSYLGSTPAHEAFGMDEATLKGLSEDGINAVIFERNRDRPVEEVLDNLRRSHLQVLETLRATPFEQLLAPRDPNDPQKRPLVNWVIGNTYEHYDEHRHYIERLASQAR